MRNKVIRKSERDGEWKKNEGDGRREGNLEGLHARDGGQKESKTSGEKE